MRRVFNGFGRALVVVSVLVSLSIPAEARPLSRERGTIIDNPIVRVVNVLKKLVIRTFGDGLTDPKP
jgi:hypothetical protein